MKRIIAIAIVGITLSGCYMVPMAFIGPATSGFTTASIIQSTVTSAANHMVKKTTGKSIKDHAYEAITKENALVNTYAKIDQNNLAIKTIIPPKKPKLK